MQSPIIDEIAEEMGDTIKVGKINVDDNQDLARRYEVMSIPTLLIIKDGNIIKQFVGLTDKALIIENLA